MNNMIAQRNSRNSAHVQVSQDFIVVQLLSCIWLWRAAWPHGLQHTRIPCPSPSPRVCSNSCPLCWWCHPTVSSSVYPFSSCPQSSRHQGLFHWVYSSHHLPRADNQIKDLLSMALPSRTRPSFAHSHSLPSGSKNYNPTASRMKTTITEN